MDADQLCDRIDRYGALYMLCTRWHSGQCSKGYRILSRLIIAGYEPGLSVQNGKFESEQQRQYYKQYGKSRHTL